MSMVYLLHQLLSESALRYPDKEAVVFKGDALTYAELDRESDRLAYTLSKIGIEKGDRVGIYLNRSITSLTGLYGILKAGAAYVPIDPACPQGRLSYILDKCGIKSLLTGREKLTIIEQVLSSGASLESILVMNGLNSGPRPLVSEKLIDWKEIRSDELETAPRIDTKDSDVAYILFTSGSTGNPKGVMISHLNSLSFINAAYDFFSIQKNDRFSNVCPLHFDMSVFDLFVACKAGATVVIIPETTAMFPARLAEVIEKENISVWNSVPSTLSLLATNQNLDSHDLSSLRLVLFAGELFPLKYLRRVKDAVPGARFCNMYGQTEANSSTFYWVDTLPSDARESLPIGKALPGFDVFALNGAGEKIVKPGDEGELYVRSSTVALGYWGEPEKTEGVFVNNPLRPDLNERVYRTGDLVRLDPAGNYVFLGRKDHMIKSRGYRIELGEIETVLCDHPEISNAVVVPIPDEILGNRISAIVVPFTPGTVTKEDVLQHCARRLPKYMIPETIEVRNSLPLTSSGKVDRQKLIHPDEAASCSITSIS